MQESRDGARRAELAHQIDIADVDAEFERSGCDKRFELAMLETMFGIAPLLLGHAAMMCGDLIGAQALGQGAGRALGHAAGVHKDQGRAMIADQLGEPVMDKLADIARHHGFERRRGKLEGEVTRPAMAGVNNLAADAPRAIRPRARQKLRDRLDRFLGRRQADPQQAITAQHRQALKRKREMSAALVWRERVDFVDNDGPRRGQHPAARLRRQQDVKRFRRRDEDMRRPAAHLVALALRRIAGADQGADFNVGQAMRAQSLANSGQRRF